MLLEITLPDDAVFKASAQVLANFIYDFNDQLIEVTDWRCEMRKVTWSFDLFWRMPSGFAESYGYKSYKWFKGSVDPMSKVKPDGMYIVPFVSFVP